MKPTCPGCKTPLLWNWNTETYFLVDYGSDGNTTPINEKYTEHTCICGEVLTIMCEGGAAYNHEGMADSPDWEELAK